MRSDLVQSFSTSFYVCVLCVRARTGGESYVKIHFPLAFIYLGKTNLDHMHQFNVVVFLAGYVTDSKISSSIKI